MTRIKPLFERGRLTDYLLGALPTLLSGSNILVGDAIAPRPGGWPSQPGQGTFVGYVVLATGPATPRSQQPLGEPESDDWSAVYTLRSVGGLRSQVDWIADRVRNAWNQLTVGPLELGESYWKLYQPSISRMGSVDRNDATDPPYWEIADTVSVSLARSRRA